MAYLRGLLQALTLFTLAVCGTARAGDSVPLSTGEIVRHMMESDAKRAVLCQHYSGMRDYHLTYHGFAGSKEAAMRVEMTYDAPNQKHFRVVSSSGSKTLVDHVLKKLMESEQEASHDPTHISLTPANYKFDFERVEQSGPEKMLVLRVTPRTDSKFLYRGHIWVDATEYAVSRIEAQPAKNPSFWTKSVDIHHTYEKVGPCWLANEDRSDTKVRFGGSSQLTIKYSDYKIETAEAQTR